MSPQAPPPIIKVRCTKSRLYHSNMVKGLAEDVIMREKKHLLEERLKTETDEQIYGKNGEHTESANAILSGTSTGGGRIAASDLGDRGGDNDNADDESSMTADGKQRPVIFIDIVHNQAYVSVAAAENLQRRRFKKATVDAPLRENIAAACILKTPMLQLLKEGKGLNIWDPFCGSG